MPQPTNNPAAASPHTGKAAWYRQPIVWLGMFMFVASMAGCVWIIMVAAQHPDEAVETSSRGALGVPVGAYSSHAPPPTNLP